jgi:hypothetical protein
MIYNTNGSRIFLVEKDQASPTSRNSFCTRRRYVALIATKLGVAMKIGRGDALVKMLFVELFAFQKIEV